MSPALVANARASVGAWHLRSRVQAYWPFHKARCVANDFADALEHTEPKFARWMRKHGKVAVIKDDEVDRIERKARGHALQLCG